MDSQYLIITFIVISGKYCLSQSKEKIFAAMKVISFALLFWEMEEHERRMTSSQI